MIIGNLGQDPQMRYTPSGLPVVNFSLATDERYLDKDGKRQESVQWHRIVVIGKLALACNEYLKKGRQVFVEGRLRTENGKTTAQTFDAPPIRKFHSEFATNDSRPLWCPLLLLNIVGTQRSQVARLTFAESVLATQCGSRLQ
jgi:primosomal replication protein N